MVEPVFEVDKMLRCRPWKGYTCPEISISISDILNFITAFGGFFMLSLQAVKDLLEKKLKYEMY